MRLRLLSYNIRYGGEGREAAIASAIASASPDLVVLQEATRPDVVERLAGTTGLHTWGARARHSVAFLSRLAVADHQWHHPEWSSRAFLEIVLADTRTPVFGVHLSAVHSNWTERRRVRELKALLEGIREYQHGFHVVVGDFNTLAPGEELDVSRLPYRLRPFVWMSGRRIRWETIQLMLDARYVDAFRAIHPVDKGYTFPTWDPHVRLDYVFVPVDAVERVKACEVVRGDGALPAASDHFPLLAELETA